MAKTVAIIQARMGSERLPGKVMKQADGRPLLQYLLTRLKGSKRLDEIVVATSKLAHDEKVALLAERLGVPAFAGSETDVLDRYYRAAKKHRAEKVIRITADCPLLCPAAVDATIDDHDRSGCDYTMNDVPATVPRGYDVEVFSFDVLEKLHSVATTAPEREHVTFYISRHPGSFSVNVFKDESFAGFPDARLCVDTIEDFQVVRAVIEAVYPRSPAMCHTDVREFLLENPELCKINASVIQKTVN